MRWLVFILFFSTFHLIASDEVQSVVSNLEKELGVEIKLDTGFQDTWEAVSYETVDDQTSLLTYLTLLLKEYKKYPAGFFKKVEVSTIIVCKELHFETQERAAIPDCYNNTLLLDANFQKYDTSYLTHVMHHELHHCTEFAIWGSTYYEWPEWEAINADTFLYGAGGASAYLVENMDKDYYTMCHPKTGFCTPYQMTGEEEDRCETMAFVMADYRREEYFSYCREDSLLMNKFQLLIKLMNEFWGSTDTFWYRQAEKVQ